MATLPRTQPRLVMDQIEEGRYPNGVNGRDVNNRTAAPGRRRYAQQVDTDHHQVTACGRESHGQQVTPGRYMTARTDSRMDIGTWNVKLMHYIRLENWIIYTAKQRV